LANRKEPAEVWIDVDVIKIKAVNTGNIHIADYSSDLYQKVQGVRWVEVMRNEGYLRGYLDGGLILLHHLVLPQKAGYRVGHINRNKRDHRRQNLDYVTRSESGVNRNIQPTNTIGYVGLFYDDKVSKWAARLTINGKRKFLGHFESKEAASEAYTNARKEFYPKVTKEEDSQ
jgi:hypothetical protein